MKYVFTFFLSLCALGITISGCQAQNHHFVQVEDHQFTIEGQPYYFIGTNFWYGMHLGSELEIGDRQRLQRELDMLRDMGVDNLRVLASSEGPDDEPWRVVPSVQPEPGVYNEDVLEGLDYLLAEMDKRDMRAILVLNNFFQWSGGKAQYVSWASDEPIPYPHEEENSWTEFMNYSAEFYSYDDARQWYKDYIEMLMNRENTINGRAYTEDPTIMSWQLGNEPRGMDNEEEYFDWVVETTSFISDRTSDQLVSLGGEGKLFETENTRFMETGELETLDYLTVHLWIENWARFDPYNPEETFYEATGFAHGYIADHIAAAEKLNKPVVLSEFGVARDTRNLNPQAPVTYRNKFFTTVFESLLHLAQEDSPLAGYNLWSWSGEGVPEGGEIWEPGSILTGDPPHEEQGWYGLYEHDTSTIELIREYNEQLDDVLEE